MVSLGEHLLCFNTVLLAIIVCELSFSGKIEDVTITIIGDDLLRHFWTLVHTAEIRMANIDNFLTQRVMISATKSSPTFGSLKGSSNPTHFICEINVGKRRIRHTTNLKLKIV